MTRSWHRSRRGSTAVEFALTLPMLVLTSMAVIQLGYFLTERQRFVQGTYEAARFASSGPEAPTAAQVQAHAAWVVETLGMDPTGLTVTVSRWVDGEDPVVTVEMELPVRSIGQAVTLPTTHVQQVTIVQREA